MIKELIEHRKMKTLVQVGPTCAPVCLAMVLNRTVEHIQKIANKEHSYNSMLRNKVCNILGLEIFAKESYTGPLYEGNFLPPTCLVIVVTRDERAAPHIMLRIGNMFHDPNIEYSFYDFDHHKYKVTSFQRWKTEHITYRDKDKPNIIRYDTGWRVYKNKND